MQISKEKGITEHVARRCPNGDYKVTTFRMNTHGFCKPQLEAVERRMTAVEYARFVARRKG